jgi:hypothetical protein
MLVAFSIGLAAWRGGLEVCRSAAPFVGAPPFATPGFWAAASALLRPPATLSPRLWAGKHMSEARVNVLCLPTSLSPVVLPAKHASTQKGIHSMYPESAASAFCFEWCFGGRLRRGPAICTRVAMFMRAAPLQTARLSTVPHRMAP